MLMPLLVSACMLKQPNIYIQANNTTPAICRQIEAVVEKFPSRSIRNVFITLTTIPEIYYNGVGAGGLYDSSNRTVVVSLDPNLDMFQHVLAHELAHSLQPANGQNEEVADTIANGVWPLPANFNGELNLP